MEDTYFLDPMPVLPGAAPLAAFGFPNFPMLAPLPERIFVAPIQILLGPKTNGPAF
jgi:hypothetical protein